MLYDMQHEYIKKTGRKERLPKPGVSTVGQPGISNTASEI